MRITSASPRIICWGAATRGGKSVPCTRRGRRPRRPDGMAAPGACKGGYKPPVEIWAAVRRPRGFCSRRGLVQRDAPPIFFSNLRKRKRAVHGPKEKAAWTRSGAVTLRAQRGSAYRCLLRFGLAFGHAMLFCDSCCCRPVADGAALVGVVVAWSCFSFRYRSRSREESGSA